MLSICKIYASLLFFMSFFCLINGMFFLSFD